MSISMVINLVARLMGMVGVKPKCDVYVMRVCARLHGCLICRRNVMSLCIDMPTLTLIMAHCFYLPLPRWHVYTNTICDQIILTQILCKFWFDMIYILYPLLTNRVKNLLANIHSTCFTYLSVWNGNFYKLIDINLK